MKHNVHATAIIEEGAILGNNVSIGAFSYIGAKVTIGDNTIILSHTLIEGNTNIGKHNRIFSHCVIGSIPQDLKFDGGDVKLIIGDNNTIREFAFINTGTIGGGSLTKIGNNNLIMGYVHIGHDIKIGNQCIIANATNLGGHIEIGNFVVIGAMSAIHQFVRLGDYSMLAGASALTQDLPPFCMAEGNRATLRGLNVTGLRRNISRDSIDILKRAYRELFESGNPIKDISSSLIKKSNSLEVIKISKFIQDSKRGIPYKRKNNV
ncbi:MAG: acyl-ACP--UDP-N-acetylglucosamine O-acyltransferase [Sulfurovum sp.]|nr:acyl-ACP--UDP-N-acetylglucosamine O-acyltransferase [Sulfurovaceae bacterium]